jgi:lysophospholipase L1-like esterase
MDRTSPSFRRRFAGAATIAVMAGACLSVVAAPSAHGSTASTPIAASDPNLQLLGRWGESATSDTTVNSGSRLSLRFTGAHVSALFDVTTITNPPRIYVRIDGGPATQYAVDRGEIDFTPHGLHGREHTLELDVRDVDERANRWTPPLQSGLNLTGFRLDTGARTLPPAPPQGPRIEFLGDSITQGVRSVGPQIGPEGADATKDYAWLVGSAFGGDFAQVGFGAQGVVVGGGGNVPPAPAAFGLNFAGSPVNPSYVPDAVVVNQGTNDGGVPSAEFESAYAAYLQQIRAAWPRAVIFALRPFNGAHAGDISTAVSSLADWRTVYVDTTNWLPADELTDGLHPTVAGHLNVAARLVKLITAQTRWRAARTPSASTTLLGLGSTPGFESGSQVGWQAGSHISSVAVSGTPPVSGTTAYEGGYALGAASTVAPLDEWRTITFRPHRPLRLPSSTRDVFAYVAVAAGAPSFFDARVTVRSGVHTQTVTTENIPNLGGFLPWDRIHLNLAGSARPVDEISISVRGEGTSASGSLSFQVDDVGVTDHLDG